MASSQLYIADLAPKENLGATQVRGGQWAGPKSQMQNFPQISEFLSSRGKFYAKNRFFMSKNVKNAPFTKKIDF